MGNGERNRIDAAYWIEAVWFKLSDALVGGGYLKAEIGTEVTQAVLRFTQDLRNK